MENVTSIPIVKNREFTLAVLAVAGFAAVVVGIFQGVVHVAPGYEGMVGNGGEVLDRRGWLLVGMGAVGIGGAALSARRTRLSVVPMAVGTVVLFEAVRTVALVAQTFPYPIYTETTYRTSGDPVMFVLGAEPFLLVAGGLLLVGAGVVGLRGRTNRENGDETSPRSSAVA